MTYELFHIDAFALRKSIIENNKSISNVRAIFKGGHWELFDNEIAPRTGKTVIDILYLDQIDRDRIEKRNDAKKKTFMDAPLFLPYPPPPSLTITPYPTPS